ncbi:MAG: MraY family glycosyltransferase, partial [Proteobacteria bacterium]|nr:MraY family glycosyltransferase [Pseudomonadota bacterium]
MNYTDKILSRSSHKSIATRSGGVSIFLMLFLISLYFYLDGKALFDYSFIVPLSLLVLVGLYDDINNIDYKLKFIFQIIAAKIIIDNGLIIDNLHGLLGIYEINRFIAHIITMLITVAIINSINFIDGIDGLAVTIVSMFIILFEFLSITYTPFILLNMILLGSFIPLLIFNFKNKNKVFLGDSGSYFLGGIVSIYVLHIFSN